VRAFVDDRYVMPQLPLSPNGSWLQRLHQRGELYRQIVETTSEGAWVIDAEAHTVFVNEQMACMLGYDIESMLGRHLFAYMDDEGRALATRQLERRKQGLREQHEFKFQRKDGKAVWALLATSPLLDDEGRYAGALAMVADITARKDAERLLQEAKDELEQRVDERTRQLLEANRRLEELAMRDPLTGLLNRRALQERLDQELSRARRHGTPLSALVLDVDHFKQINDSAGHDAGDAVLRQLGGLLEEIVRDGDIVARYGGEEFVVVAPHTAQQGALVLAERIRGRVEATKCNSRSWFGRVTVSVGTAELEQAPASAESLLTRADAAMYQAKHQGRNRVCTCSSTS
jgi:diguanylate cyclase (GGDEF)-like protein/PAS domain S-box-containing protein